MNLYEHQATPSEVDADRVQLLNRAKQLIRSNPDGLEGRDAEEFDDIGRKLERANEAYEDALKREAIRKSPFRDHGANDPLRDAADSSVPKSFRNPWELTRNETWASRTAGADEYHSRALSAFEEMPGASDSVKAGATKIVEQYDDASGNLSRQMLATSDPVYMRAFGELLRSPNALLSVEETQAVRQARDLQRAMSLTTTAGGFLLPTQLDPTVVITSDGTANQTRRMFRNVVATSNVWYGVSSPYASWSVDAEAAEVSDDTTTFAQPSIDIYKIAGFIPISIEALMDEQNVTTEIARILALGKDNLEAQLFTTGSGSGEHTGVATAVAAVTTSRVAATTNDALGLSDIYAIDEALPARYRSNAGWLMHRYTMNAIRQFDTSGGAGLWEVLENDRPAQLLGAPVFEAESMDGAITGSADNDLIIYGDRGAFVIADRVGMVIEPTGHLFGTTNQRPTGQKGFYAYARSGSDVVNVGGLRLLRV